MLVNLFYFSEGIWIKKELRPQLTTFMSRGEKHGLITIMVINYFFFESTLFNNANPHPAIISKYTYYYIKID